MAKTRTCVACGKVFVMSSRHRKCPACRPVKKERQCVDCGKAVRYAQRCRSCSNKAMQPRKRTEVGTRKETAKGYIKIYVPDHPNAKDGWEFEHRIVMEKALGRYLLPDETVHHKFGIRSDNKIENLELWIKPQPSGIRVEDAVVWAKRILERYGTK